MGRFTALGAKNAIWLAWEASVMPAPGEVRGTPANDYDWRKADVDRPSWLTAIVISSQMESSGGSEITAIKELSSLVPVQPEPERG